MVIKKRLEWEIPESQRHARSVLKDDEEERDLSWTFVAELFRRVKERRRRHRLFRKGTIEEHVGG